MVSELLPLLPEKKRHKKIKHDILIKQVIKVIRQIPKGRVLTYGQVAILVGMPRGARAVGRILFQNGLETKLPWQRVLNAQGKLSTYRVGMGEEQRRLLEDEGLHFNQAGAIDLKKYQWWPSPAELKSFSLDEETAYRISQKLGF